MRGFTLIEVLIASSLTVIVFLSIFGIYNLGIKMAGISRNQTIAAAIANEHIEKIHNLSYEKIGIQGNPIFPNGLLQSTQTTILNNIQFTIETDVNYVIDNADGSGDTCPYDYKKVQIKVSWPGLLGGEIIFTTDIAPKNLSEECITPGGILTISVFDALGQMVSSPSISILDPITNSELDNATPFNGNYNFALPAGNYKVIVTKNGYSTERTYSVDEISNPEKPNLIVLQTQTTENSFSIDRLSSFIVQTKTLSSIIVPNAPFGLRGEKTIGTDDQDNHVYKYNEDHATDQSGYLEIPNLEWDLYNFSIDPSSGLDLVDISPSPQPISLAPDSNQNIILYLDSDNSLLLNIQNASSTDPIFAAEARVFNNDYDKTQQTNINGQTLFMPIDADLYNVYVQAPGYANKNSSVNIAGDTTKTILLEQVE